MVILNLSCQERHVRTEIPPEILLNMLESLLDTFCALLDISEKVIEISTEVLYNKMRNVILSGDAERRTVGDHCLLTAGAS